MRPQTPRINRRTSRRYHIADKLMPPRTFRARNHRRLRHARVPNQRRLNLPRLNAKTANLNLLVRTPHKLQNPIPAPARQVPAAVHPAPRSPKPIRNKTLRRLPPTTQITPRQTSARDVKLPNNPSRNWLQTLVQHINTRVPYRTTNRNVRRGLICLHTAVCSRPDATLGWAILIYQRNC